MKLKTKTPLLKFDPGQAALTQSLSAAVFIGDHLWVASDEQTSVERLATSDGITFGKHKSFQLGGVIALPAAGTNFDQEIDIEGLDFQDSHLWLVGSHSVKRKNVKVSDTDPDEKLINKLSKVEAEGNRFVLARIPLDKSEQELRQPASQLAGGVKSNALIEAIRQADDGKGDPHLTRFLDIPGKDNGFDIEGLTVAGDRVFVGLRGPVLRGWAVVLELSIKVADSGALKLRALGDNGRRYRKHFLDLNGLGVRDLCVHQDDLLILAGPTMNLDGPTAIFKCRDLSTRKGDSFVRGKDLARIMEIPFGHLSDHAEGFAFVPDTQPRQILVVYDSPDKNRMKDAGTIQVDVFELPQT
jgi:hypothetical protein